MDISFKTEGGSFSLRAAALVMDQNRLLIAKDDKFDCFYIVGGTIRENETSDQTVIRELYEETGYHFEIDRLVFVQERFFPIETSHHYEVVFFYLMKNTNFEISNGASTDHPGEHLYWVPLEELQRVHLVPEFLKTAMQNIPNELTHIVSCES